MSYDTKCYDLADAFLSDEPEMNCEEACDELAKLIQTTIEDWISYQRGQHGLPVLAVSAGKRDET